MGTRSDIIVHCSDDKWRRVYCHWDGYLDHNGRILFESYNDRDRATALVMPGDMSSLDADCTKPEGHSYDKPVKGHTVYYGRDRGEKETEPRVGDSVTEVWPGEDSWTEYTYVFREDAGSFKWFYTKPRKGPDTLKDLGVALSKEEGEEDEEA